MQDGVWNAHSIGLEGCRRSSGNAPADADGRALPDCCRWCCAPAAVPPGSSLSSPSLASLCPPSTAAMARLPPMKPGWSVLMYANSHATQSRIMRSAGACGRSPPEFKAIITVPMWHAGLPQCSLKRALRCTIEKRLHYC